MTKKKDQKKSSFSLKVLGRVIGICFTTIKYLLFWWWPAS